MRQLLIQVPRGSGEEVLRIAAEHEGANLARVAADNRDGERDLVVVHVSNGRVEALLRDLEHVEDTHVTLVPTGVLVLRPPPEQAPAQVVDVQGVSPIEILLQGLQSIGSWRGFLAYAAIAGFVVWIGLYTNAASLLVGAMLIAPFAGPAMNAAMGTARGDLALLGRSVARYGAALTVTVAVAFLVTLILRQHSMPPLAVEVASLSSVAVLLPLAAGAAGALHLSQSEHSSLVSGAAVGVLVAASIAPPAGVIGMASALGRWELARDGLFLLLLQLVGINVSGALLFRFIGIRPKGTRFSRGRRPVLWLGLATSVLALAALLFWQLHDPPALQHGSRAQRAAGDVADIVNAMDGVELVEAQARFTRPEPASDDLLLVTLYVRPSATSAESDDVLRQRLTRELERRLRKSFAVTPLIDLTVFDGAAAGVSRR